MTAVLLRVRAELRGRWASWLALAALAAVFAGSVMAVSAGARRTDTAYQRLVVASRAPNMMVFDESPDPSFARFDPSTLARLAAVSQTGQVAAYNAMRPTDIGLAAPVDDVVGSVMWTRKILSGRLPDPHRADEVSVGFTAAEADHIRVGDILRLDLQPRSGTAPVRVQLHVVGIDAAVSEFPPQTGTGDHSAWTTPAFARAHRGDVATLPVTMLRFTHGDADAPAVDSALAELAHGRPSQAFLLSSQSMNTEHSIHLQAIALWVLAALLAVAGLLVVGQLLVRQSDLESGGLRDLHALGMTSRQLWGVGMARSAVVGVVAGVMAVGLAAAASGIFPIGLAGVAEPHPGFAPDLVVLGIGFVLTMAAVVVCGAWPNWRAARTSVAGSGATAAAVHPSRVVAFSQAVGAPVTAVTGVSFALEKRRGRAAVPVRSTVGAAVVGVAALAGGITFSASLAHLLATPRLYGTTWDAAVSSVGGEGVPVTPALAGVRADHDVDAVAVGYAGFPIQLGGARIDGMALEPAGTPLRPIALVGRLPQAADEIMVGTRDLDAQHLHIGSQVRIRITSVDDPHPLRVVGAGVFPTLSDQLGLGHGAYVTTATLREAIRRNFPPPDTILVRFRAGTDARAARARLEAAVGDHDMFTVAPAAEPVDLVNFGRVETLPLGVGVLLGVLAIGTLAHLLVSSIRRRRRDLALLKVMGLVPAQLRRAVAWQASTIAMAAVVIGVPLGLVIGRWTWFALARQLGVVGVPIIPVSSWLVLAVAALVIANLIALVPAQVAARTKVAEILRTS